MKHLLLTTIAAILLIGCVSSPDHSGTYTLSDLKKDMVLTFELKPDGSFIGTNSKEKDDDLIGSWKVEGELLVCEGTTEKHSEKIIIKFNKSIGKLEFSYRRWQRAPTEELDGLIVKKN